MNLAFRPTDYASEADCAAIAAWRNDSGLRSLWLPARSGEMAGAVTAADVRREGLKQDARAPRVDELALLNGRVVGQFTILVNPPMRRSTHAAVAWPSLIVGEASLRGSGILRRFGPRMLAVARELGCTHFEAGVFEFNTPMRRLLEKTGFRAFARIENVTQRDGRASAAVHYEREVALPF